MIFLFKKIILVTWLFIPFQQNIKFLIKTQVKNSTQTILVGGIPTPLKNHGVRQLGFWNYWMDSHNPFHGSKPPEFLSMN